MRKYAWLAVIVLGVLGLLPSPDARGQAPGPNPQSLGLRDALGLAIQHNRTLLSAELDIDIAEANALAATGLEDWQIDANVNFQANRRAAVSGQPFQQTSFDDLHVDASVTKPLGYGGRLGVKLGNDFVHTVNLIDLGTGAPFESTTDIWTPTAAVTYFQSLLRGGGERTFLAAQRRAAVSRDVAILERGNLAAGAVRDVVQAYWELAFALKDLEIRKSSLDLAREQLRITQARLDVGVGAPTDVAAVQQTIATRTEDLLVSEQLAASRAYDLRLVLGIDIRPGALGLSASDPLAAAPRDVSLEAAIAGAIEHNPQIAAAQARGRLAQIDVEVTENGLLPQLDLSIVAGPSGNASNAGEAYKQLVKLDSFSATAGLALSWPVANHNAEGLHAVAQRTLHKVRLTEDDIRAQVAIGVARNHDLLRSAQQRMLVDAEATKYARVNLAAEKARFEVGRTTNFEVLRRQDELAQSLLREARAATDYLKALAGLQSLTGEILPSYSITLRQRGQ